MNSADSNAAHMLTLSRRIARRDVRTLFIRFCHEVALFSEAIEMEESPFELTLREPCGFAITLSPLRELFLVSIGEERSTDIRVSSAESLFAALDLALGSYLSLKSRAPKGP